MEIADVGGWNLDIHHMYNFESGEKRKKKSSFVSFETINLIFLYVFSSGVINKSSIVINKSTKVINKA